MKTDEPFYNWFVLSSIVSNPRILKNLLDNFGSSAEIIEQQFCHRDLQREYDYARDAEEICLNSKITTMTLEDPNYPVLLKQIPDPPAILYIKGKVPARNEKMIAIVGSRKASKYMINQAKMLAKKIADNNTIVISGMAEGSDRAAHQGVLYVRKRTIAVLGTSLTFKTKKETPKTKEVQKTIDNIIANNGCIMSEVQPWENYDSGKNGANLVKRNRITTALSDAVIITECDEKSGTMHAIHYAREQGKSVYAIPPVPGKSAYYDHMHYLKLQGMLEVLDNDIIEQILLSINRNCRA